MPFNRNELIKAISIVADNEGIQVCVEQSTKGAVVCGAMSLLGGLLMGPRGLAVGGALGGLIAYSMPAGSFKLMPIGEVLRNELTNQQKNAFINHLRAAVSEIGISDLMLLIKMLSLNAKIREKVMDTMVSFFRNSLGMQVLSF